VTAAHCAGCGRLSEECDGDCAGDLDPPRFCTECGRRLAVQVYPTRVVARCPYAADHVAAR